MDGRTMKYDDVDATGLVMEIGAIGATCIGYSPPRTRPADTLREYAQAYRVNIRRSLRVSSTSPIGTPVELDCNKETNLVALR